MKNILAISGSLRSSSINRAIIRQTAEMFTHQLDVKIFEGLSDLPMFDPDLDNDHPPEPVRMLRRSVRDADGVLICTPEYVFSIPAALKNALEWMVSSSDLAGKPTALITASTSGEEGHRSLLLVLRTIEAKLGDETQLLIRAPKTKMKADGTITDEMTYNSIRSVMEALIRSIDE